MYTVGDKVVHPQHGAGVVKAIEEDVIQGFGCYYVIDLTAYNRTLRIPVDKARDVGLRIVSAPEVMTEVLSILNGSPGNLPGNYIQRQTELGGRLRAGNAAGVAEVMRDLTWRSYSKHLTSQDNGFLEQARKFLASELALSRGIDFDQAVTILNQTVASE